MPFFEIYTHRAPAQHIREYKRGIADEASDYFIVAKQYVPKTDRPSQEGDITVIACSGIGMIKEIYEPLFEETTRRCIAQNVYIRSFWIADNACVGDSAIINKENLTSEQNWFDHSRDLLLMINTFRKIMPSPLVGLGHSMGGAQIAYLASIHPRLFYTILFIEPAIHKGLDRAVLLAQIKAITRRRESWPTHNEAAAEIKKNRFYQSWDKRCVDLLINHSFIPDPNGTNLVYTKTPRNMEVAQILRPNLRGVGTKGLHQMSADDRSAFPDLDPEMNWLFPSYRAEQFAALKLLPTLRPSACFILGTNSQYSTDEMRKIRMETTGIAVGGSGGAKLGRVAEYLIPGGGHQMMFDAKHLPLVSDKACEWLVLEMRRWSREQEEHSKWAGRSAKEKSDVHPVILESLKEWHPTKNPDIEKIAKSKI